MTPLLSPAKNKRVHVVIGSSPCFSHFEKFKVIGAHLVKRGNRVTIVTGEPVRHEVQSIGAFFAPMKGRAGIVPAKSKPPPPLFAEEHERSALKNFFIDNIPDQYESVQAALRQIQRTEGPETAIIYMDDIVCGAMLPVYFDVPGAIKPTAVIAIGTTPLPHESAGVATWGLGASSNPSNPYAFRNLWATKKEIYQSEEIHTHFKEVLRGLGACVGALNSSPRFLHSQGIFCDLYLALSIPEFEQPRSDLPDSVRFVGALSEVGHESSSLPVWWEEVLHARYENKKPIVIVSQGALNNNPRHLILPTLEGLKEEDVIVIATLIRGSQLPPNVPIPQNARLADFIPFHILLEHTDVLVSNGGFGTVQMAISRGVPMVLAGVYFDKAYTNFRAASIGAAINLENEQVEPEQVRKAVCDILTDQRRQEQCLELREIYATYDALACITDAVDALGVR